MTLTELSYYVRKYYPFAILGVIIILILYYSVVLVGLYIEARRVTPVFTNTVFGKIKKPYLTDASASGNLRFRLDTVSGNADPETATETAKVFFLPPTQTKFGYKERVFLMAKNIGFNTETTPYKLVVNQAIFENPQEKLTVDIRNFSFSYRYFFENNAGLINAADTPSGDESRSKAIEFLQSLDTDTYPPELAQGDTNVIFLRYNPAKRSISILKDNIKANLVEVDFYRPKIEGFPVVSPKFFNSQNYVLMEFASGEAKILRADLKYFQKSEDQVGVYPLKTGQQAYDELVQGKGMVVSNPQGRKNITIHKVFLAYLDPDVYQDYMEPVYVFLGSENDSFVAYVPAVSNEFLIE